MLLIYQSPDEIFQQANFEPHFSRYPQRLLLWTCRCLATFPTTCKKLRTQFKLSKKAIFISLTKHLIFQTWKRRVKRFCGIFFFDFTLRTLVWCRPSFFRPCIPLMLSVYYRLWVARRISRRWNFPDSSSRLWKRGWRTAKNDSILFQLCA